MKLQNSKDKRLKRNRSKLKKVNVDRFRITVFKSLKNISAQIIDDSNNRTIVSASSKDKDIKGNKINKTKMSEAIGEILAKKANIFKNITFHIARHSFATTITLNNDVPLITVSKMLGHTTTRTTQIYAKVLQKKVSLDMQKLNKKLFD